MTDKDTKSSAPSVAGSSAVMVDGSSVVMVDKSSSSRHKPFRPGDLQEGGVVEQHHKRSRAPAVPSMTPAKLNHGSSKVSSKRASSPEAISTAAIEMDIQRADIVPTPTQPIPSTAIPAPGVTGTKDQIEQDDSITEEVTELRTSESPHREWSDEEAGGLPRSESRVSGESRGSRASRISRMSRVVRQLICCGVPYNRPSEYNVSSPRTGDFPDGI